MTFEESLKYGHEGEDIVIEKLSKHFKCFKVDGYFPYYDLICVSPNGSVYKVEVKRDAKFKETGNVAIEVRYKGKEKIRYGISDVIIYVLGEDVYWIKRKELVNLLDNLSYHNQIVKGGDGGRSELILVSVYEFTRIFKKV